MTTKHLACAAILCVFLIQAAHAQQPDLLVTCADVDEDGYHNWLVEVKPNVTGSIAVELAFAVDDAELIDVLVNTAVWDHETAGLNPFTNDIVIGLWVDLIGDQTYGAFGSLSFTTLDPVELFTIRTSADFQQTLRYGVAASGDNELGARMAQGSTNYDGYTGTVTCVPEPSGVLLAIVGLIGLGLSVRRQRIA
jgi:hypothetical protein